MPGPNEIVQVKEGVEGSSVLEQLKTSFSQVEKVFLSTQEKLRTEIQEKNRENELLVGKLQRFKKENMELRGLRGLVTRVMEERDGLLKKVKENEDDKKEIIVLKRKNCDLECAKLNAETEVDVCKGTIKEKQDELQRFEKEYAELTEGRDGLQKFENECGELKELVTRLTEERDGLLKRVKENQEEKKEISELKRKNCELECAKLNAETEVDVCKGKIKEERDELFKRVKENKKDKEEIIELKRKNCELECAKLKMESLLSSEKDCQIEKGELVNLTLDTNAVKLLLGRSSNPSGREGTGM